jgi:flagellar biogenesis protein FliO
MTWQQFSAIFLVLGLLLLALSLLRQKGLVRFVPRLIRQTGKQRRMQVLERVALDTRHSLHLVALNGRLIVVGVSPSGCRRIAAVPANAAMLLPNANTPCDPATETAPL